MLGIQLLLNWSTFQDLSASSSSSSPYLCSLQQLHAMQQAGNVHGEALALESMAQTLEYMGSISQACETLESVCLLKLTVYFILGLCKS